MKFSTSILFPLAAGAFASASGSTSTITITSNKLTRSFLLWVSSTYSSKTPGSVLLSFHGGNKTAKDQLELDGFTTADTNAVSIVVYPQGVKGVPGDTINDVLFTNDILDYLESKYNVDTARIYASGKSDGGGFCNILACDARASRRIAAFAPVSGAFYVAASPCHPDTVPLLARCRGRADVPLIEFHGGNDSTIHYAAQWALRNELGLQNQTSAVAPNTVAYKYGSGDKAGLVTHVFESDIGHDWPSTAPNADNSKKGPPCGELQCHAHHFGLFFQISLTAWSFDRDTTSEK
ncbi:ferulic acid esterase (FaeA), putative [Cordyceps militaris CM01]|uniref:feruloyl esterase n=1 Tax=Cordyceps militaris (strain CM01) TaxID=983644 RepID=G3JMD3_CORMM|nr:ferulic acid esterase (FaeA), putative [Cordyceps militaris CM01]EGX90021.1 ferulic acid esterase (FaeA), putative [Cordyceps militaris CM01]